MMKHFGKFLRLFQTYVKEFTFPDDPELPDGVRE